MHDLTQNTEPRPPVPAEPHESGPPPKPEPCTCRRDGLGFCYHAMVDVLDGTPLLR